MPTSKTKGTLLVALELAEQYGEQGIVSIVLNPGNVHTELMRHMSNAVASFWVRSTLRYQNLIRIYGRGCRRQCLTA